MIQDEFKQLGVAITGKEQSTNQVKAQMARAEFDGNGKLDKQEWLNYSAMLANLPEKVFNATMDNAIKKVKKMNG